MRYRTAAAGSGLLICGAILIVSMMNCTGAASPHNPDYSFDGSISRNVLQNYLSKSITMADLLRPSPCDDHVAAQTTDDLRMLGNTRAKFVGRTIGFFTAMNKWWVNHLLEEGKKVAAMVHKLDPEIILQGAIYESIDDDVGDVPIPEAVLKEFGQPIGKRTFDYQAMLYKTPASRYHNKWSKGRSVPDISQVETRMWFFYLSTRFLDIGIEAIHFGQIELMDDADPDHDHWNDLLSRVRAYAAKHARRHFVLCDAHVPGGGLVREGNLLLDFHSFPVRPKNVKGKSGECVLEAGFLDSLYGRSKGGVTPSGWTCDSLPYLVELDNWGASGHEGEFNYADGYWPWGYDEIGWFAHQDSDYRNQWLRYAWDWLRKRDPNGFLQMPGSRYLAVPIRGKRWYWANTPSEDSLGGFGQEETIKDIWGSQRILEPEGSIQ